MIISYDEFTDLLNKKIKTGNEFYVDLLENIISNPSRYSGIFRLTNAKTKLIQNVTQCNEIKFGEFIEEIVTYYIERLGYQNLKKNIKDNESENWLNTDQYFTDGSAFFLVEQKVRDDHDSTKKRGQFNNFHEKIKLIRNINKGHKLNAIMWFIDDNLTKNKKFYESEIKKLSYKNTDIYLFYGSEFFHSLNNGAEAWNEFTSYLTRKRYEDSYETINIPDFGNSNEIYDALLKISKKSWIKLLSNDSKYIQLRKELFSNGENLKKANEFIFKNQSQKEQ
ncbi:HpyAIV family type II restriction enzyme [Mycoplasmopsis primatum]|uniref:HpyAIV family type II restriction enzyme n=1 Tax=Mycoplasmopsis primatum TaxID=55604 RepID=UPI0006921651|nr:hypothetical protein [Mycoplasmopsis primatum]